MIPLNSLSIGNLTCHYIMLLFTSTVESAEKWEELTLRNPTLDHGSGMSLLHYFSFFY